MEQITTATIHLSLLIHIILMVIVAWRLWNGENVIDRLVASDLLGNLTLAVLVIVALIHREKIYIDVAVGFAALGYIAIIAFAKYIADKKMF
jgi:multisubunit Na+/H+ antiporter MnhF subunit